MLIKKGADPGVLGGRDRVDPAPIAIIMGSQSDWATLRHAADTLDELGLEYEARIVSAHLPGMTAAFTILPVFGVPVSSKALSGQDSLYSIVQMPAGVPVGALAIGEAGAVNAALLAAAVLALSDERLSARLQSWRDARRDAVAEFPQDGGGV